MTPSTTATPALTPAVTTPSSASANAITADLLIRIGREFPDSVRAWRANVLVARVMGRDGKPRLMRAGVKGQADVSGIVGPHGTRLEIEVKAGADRMSPLQTAWRAMILAHGGIHIVARDVEECLRELRREIERRGR